VVSWVRFPPSPFPRLRNFRQSTVLEKPTM
jgi:hypothetical protein